MKERWFEIFDRLCEYSIYGLIFFIPISKSAIEILFAVAFCSFCIKKTLRPEFSFLKSYPHLFLALFLFFSGLSMLNSGPYIETSLKAFFFKWFEYIIIFLLVEDTLSNPQRFKNAIRILLLVGAVVGVDALGQRFLARELLRNRPMLEVQGGVFAITGPLEHYNNFGAYILCVLTLAVGLLFFPHLKKMYRIGVVVMVVLLGLCLLLTLSRGSWLSFVIAIILMLILLGRKTRLVLPLLIVFIAMMLLIPALRDRVLMSFTAGADMTRFEIWKGAWLMVRENPVLGKGIGTFMDYCARYTKDASVRYAHNCYLQIWAETGFFSLISFLAFVGALWYRGVKAFKACDDFLLLGLLSALFGFLFHSFFDTHLYSLQLAVLFWVMIGLVAARTQVKPAEGRREVKILIINPFGIGDVLFTTPLIEVLKKERPGSFIGYVCNKRAAEVLKTNPFVQKIFIFEKDDYRSAWRTSKIGCIKKLLDFLRSVKTERFDAAIDVSLDYKIGILLFFAGIKKRIGFNYKNRGRFLTDKIVLDGFSEKHVASYYLDLLQFLAIDTKKYKTTLTVHPHEDDARWAGAFLSEHGVRKEDTLVGLVPGGGASWGIDAENKHWDKVKFASVADALVEERKARIVIFGDIQDMQACKGVQEAMRHAPIMACGKTTVGQFLGLLQRCRLVITNDGGPLHMAVALGVKTVSIFGPVDERIYGPYPLSADHIVISSSDVSCRPCYKRFKYTSCDDRRCLAAITAEEVLNASRKML